MTPRQRASIILTLLFALCVAVPTLLAYEAGSRRYDRELEDLNRRVQRLEQDVGDLLE